MTAGSEAIRARVKIQSILPETLVGSANRCLVANGTLHAVQSELCAAIVATSAVKRAITGDTALRFEHWFGTDAQFWINLQAQFDLAVADQATGEQIKKLPTRATYAARPPSDQPRLV
jgi:addiction module HigA family antidote